jgi:hypothetical protein
MEPNEKLFKRCRLGYGVREKKTEAQQKTRKTGQN